jgi:hypothetical protein
MMTIRWSAAGMLRTADGWTGGQPDRDTASLLNRIIAVQRGQ